MFQRQKSVARKAARRLISYTVQSIMWLAPLYAPVPRELIPFCLQQPDSAPVVKAVLREPGADRQTPPDCAGLSTKGARLSRAEHRQWKLLVKHLN